LQIGLIPDGKALSCGGKADSAESEILRPRLVDAQDEGICTPIVWAETKADSEIEFYNAASARLVVPETLTLLNDVAGNAFGSVKRIRYRVRCVSNAIPLG
jgi:hypothetical protein